jgi:hypothetical protein
MAVQHAGMGWWWGVAAPVAGACVLTASSSRLWMVGSWLGPVFIDVAMFSSSSTCSATGPASTPCKEMQTHQCTVCALLKAQARKGPASTLQE